MKWFRKRRRSLGQQLKEWRRKQMLTQQDLADRLGVGRGTVAKWEADLTKPSVAKRRALVQAGFRVAKTRS